MPRIATMRDIPALKKIWKDCFGDSDTFIDFFFNKRFAEGFSVVAEEDGKIVNVMHSYPFHIRIRDKIVLGAVLAGFATLPKYRKKGHMGNSLLFLMQTLRKKGVCLAVHTPAVLESYFKQGHITVSESAFITKNRALELPAEHSSAIDIEMPDCADILWSVYNNFSKNYSGIISRSLEDMKLKLYDYYSDGAKCIYIASDGEPVAYAVYYDTAKYLHSEETVALSQQYYDEITSALCNIAKNKKITVKFPPDVKSVLKNNTEIKPRGVMGMVNAKETLKNIGVSKDIPIRIKDSFFKENNCNVTLSGEVTDKDAVLEITAGGLCQLVCGYKTLYEIVSDNNAVIYEKEQCCIIDSLFPKQKCFIVDEY